MNQEKLSDALQWRYAVKKFDTQKKIDKKTWASLEEALILTPSSYGLQPWKFYIITNQELLQKLTPISWNQKQISECSHLVVFATKTSIDENYIKEFLTSMALTRNVPLESFQGYQKMMEGDLVKGPRSTWIKEWAARQAYIALGNFMTAAAVLKVDTCPMEGIDPQAYDKALNITDSGYQTIVACAAGYRSTDDKYQSAKKVRFEKNKMIVNLD